MSKFIYQIEKKELEKYVELKFYINNDKNETEIKLIKIPYSINISKKGFDSLNIQNDRIIISKEKRKNKIGEIIIKLEINNKELYDYLIEQIKEEKIDTYEADISKEHQYLIEKEIKLEFEEEERESRLEIKSNLKKNKNSIKHIKSKSIKNNSNNKLRYVSIDIETIGEKEKQEIILISSYSPFEDKINKVYVNSREISDENLNKIKIKKFKEFKIIIVQNEKEVLEKFKEDIIEFDAQAIIGWNVIDFDFKVIKERMKEYNIDFKFSRYGEENCRLRINKDFFKDSTMNCEGTLILDGIQLLKTNFIAFEDYKLDTVAKAVLKDSKIDLMSENENSDSSIENKLKAIEKMFKEDPIKLIKYNFKDSLLTSKIIEKLNLIELMRKRSILSGTPISRVKSPIATLDIMYLKELHKRGLVARSNFNYSGNTPIEGAFVVEPNKGFYEDIFVLDFKSLYPSIIMTFNIDPFTHYENNSSNEPNEVKKNLKLRKKTESRLIKAPNGARFSSKLGILPELISKLYDERDLAKKEKDEIKSSVLKITMNSFYGAMASAKSRYHNKEVGGAITSFGREIIRKAKLFVEDLGHKVVYGDTDSIFVQIAKSKGEKFETKKSLGFELEKELNIYFDKYVKEGFGQKSYLKIELEKIYSKFFIASKKRYVGFDMFKDKMQFVGMEAIRGDWTKLAQKFQVNLVNLIFEGADKKKIEKFILDEIISLKKGEFDKDLIYNKKITKPLNMYVKMTPPHVKAAREVKNFSGRLVKYVMIKEGAKHLSLIGEKADYDYEHYINKQLKGVSDDLLECIEIDFDSVVKKRNQKSLDSFF